MRLLLASAAAILVWVSGGAAADVELWTFDRLDRVGGHQTTVLGGPRVVDTSVGKAIEFDRVADALVVDVHPLAGAGTFIWEAIFRPDGGETEHSPARRLVSRRGGVRRPRVQELCERHTGRRR